jgi:hypothetical protein
MKLIRRRPTPPRWRISQRGSALAIRSCVSKRALAAALLVVGLVACVSQARSETEGKPIRQGSISDDPATLLATRTIERLALGDAFDAKLRQRTWVGGREVVGIGRYEQSGEGSGRLSLEMTIHDGDSRHELRQISDGKLAWFRSEVGELVTLRRIDVGRVKELHHELTRSTDPTAVFPTPAREPSDRNKIVSPWMRIGGLIELIDQIAQDFDLRVTRGKVDDKPVLILRGTINEEAKLRIRKSDATSDWPALHPYEVRVAIAAVGDETGFGVGLPLRIEFWSEPSGEPPAPSPGEGPAAPVSTPNQLSAKAAGANDNPTGRLISLLEIYSIRKIRPSPEQRFRFEREERDVTFSNDTSLYLERLEKSLGIRIEDNR